MTVLTFAALGAALILFAFVGLRARAVDGGVDDFVTARNSQGAGTLGLSFLASGMGGWILFAPPEVGAFVGPLAVLGYAVGSALPFAAFALFGRRMRAMLPEGRSLGDFVGLRFGRTMHVWVLLLSVLYMVCFVTAELTAAGSITGLLTGIDGRYAIAGVALATIGYTAVGGLRASLVTDRWQAWLLMGLLIVVGGFALSGLHPSQVKPVLAPLPEAFSVAVTLVIAVTTANLFHQGYWQRMWSARDGNELGRGAAVGMALTVVVVMAVGLLGVAAASAGLHLGEPPLPFFALLAGAPAWIALPAALLGVTLVASSVDTLENALASLVVAERPALSLNSARGITVLLMIPAVVIAMQGYSVLQLFLIADLLCATAVIPALMGLWPRVPSAAALAGSAAGVAGAILPGWVAGGSLMAGLQSAAFPGGEPTLGPFLGALVASAAVALLVMLVQPRTGD